MFKRPLCLVILAFVAAVYLYLELNPPAYDDPSYEDGESISMVGTVDFKETGSDYEGNPRIILYLKSPTQADVRIKVVLSSEYADDEIDHVPGIGETISVFGEYHAYMRATNPGEFDSRAYYHILKIEYQIMDARVERRSGNPDQIREVLYKLRSHLSRVLDDSLSTQDASVMKAMLLGDRTAMDKELKNLYSKAGIIHILSISGLHISILGMGLYSLLRRCRMGIIPASACSILVIIMYGIMCGMGTSAIRAIIMFGLRLLAQVIGRTYDMLTGLSIAALLLLIEQPLYIYHSGFLMSFGAVMGISLILPTLPDGRELPKVAGYVWETVRTSLSVSLFTLPVMMNTYYSVAVYAIFINILVLPFMAVLLTLGLVVLLLGSILHGLGGLPGIPCHFILWFYRMVCEGNQSLPGSTWYAGHAGRWQVVLYVTIILVYLLLYQLREKYFHTLEKRESDSYRELLILYGIYLILPLAVIILSIRTRPDLKLTFLHVGQGNAIVLQTSGRRYLIDGGSTSRKNVGSYVIQPYLKYEGTGYLDGIVVTHEDEDHISGILEILEEIPKGGIRVGTLILPDCAMESRTDNYTKLIETAESVNVPVSFISRGTELDSGQDGMTISCLGPEKGLRTEGANAHSTILLLQQGSFKTLLTGDVEEEGLASLNSFMSEHTDLCQNLALLQVPHHGSRFTTDEEFLNHTHPVCSIISAGEGNRYGHPHKELLERLDAIGSDYFITYEKGAITMEQNNCDNVTLNFFCDE